jgi:hypothetical protein
MVRSLEEGMPRPRNEIDLKSENGCAARKGDQSHQAADSPG